MTVHIMEDKMALEMAQRILARSGRLKVRYVPERTPEMVEAGQHWVLMNYQDRSSYEVRGTGALV